jgi:hypothetical protein
VRCYWEHVEEHIGNNKSTKDPTQTPPPPHTLLQKEKFWVPCVHADSHHWLPRIGTINAYLPLFFTIFWPWLMTGAQTVTQSLH